MTVHRAVCTLCGLPMSSDQRIEACHGCDADEGLIREDHADFEKLIDASSFGSPQAVAIRTLGSSGGLPVTDAVAQAAADEAEAGYEPDRLKPKRFTVSQLQEVHAFMLLKPCPYCGAKINEECADGAISERFHGVHKARYLETLDALGHHNARYGGSVVRSTSTARSRRTHLKG